MRMTWLFHICLFSALAVGYLVLGSHCNDNEIVDDLLNAISKIKNKKGDIVTEHRTVPAFTAVVAKDFTPEINQIIKFDVVKLNEEGGYSPSTGIFTAPRSGLYMLSATVRSTSGKKLHCELWVKDVSYINLFGTNYSTGTGAVVAKLKKGDRVYIKKDHRTGGEYMLGHDWSMFSGYLIA